MKDSATSVVESNNIYFAQSTVLGNEIFAIEFFTILVCLLVCVRAVFSRLIAFVGRFAASIANKLVIARFFLLLRFVFSSASIYSPTFRFISSNKLKSDYRKTAAVKK